MGGPRYLAFPPSLFHVKEFEERLRVEVDNSITRIAAPTFALPICDKRQIARLRHW